MALTDSLRILITANGAQAEREFAKVGATARRELGRAETSAAAWSRTLTSAGVAMGTFGAVMLAGLYKAAQAADEENAALIRLQNTISNQPALASASTDAFLDQASALQDVTQFADEATVSAQAMLGQFGLTEDQIIDLIPLVQDYAAKTGVDLDTAARNVGKSTAGMNTVLRRAGVRFDETAYQADAFGETMRALNQYAGGAAEELGQTMSGQLAILKNNLSDVVEGIGRGVIPVFNDLVGIVKTGTDAFNGLNPETQQTVGRFMALGAIGLTAGGALLVIAGQALKARETIAALGDTAVVARAKVLALKAAEMDAAVANGTYAGSNVALAGSYGSIAAASVPVAVGFSVVNSAIADFWGNVTGLFDVDIDWFHLFSGGVEDIKKRMIEVSVPTGQAAEAFDAVSSAAERAGVSIDELDQEIRDYLDGVFSVDEANRAARDSFDNLATVLFQEGRSADDVNAALQGMVEAVGGVISAGGNADGISRRMIETWRNLRDQGIISTETFRHYRDALLDIPGQVSSQFLAPGLQLQKEESKKYHAKLQQIDALNPTSNVSAPGMLTYSTHADKYTAKLRIIDATNPTSVVSAPGLDSALGKAYSLNGQFDKMDGRNVTTTVETRYITAYGTKALAEGGPFSAGESLLVGERGPELVTFPQSGRVMSNGETMSVLRRGGGGPQITVNIHGRATAADGQEVVDALRRWQQRNGPVPVRVSS